MTKRLVVMAVAVVLSACGSAGSFSGTVTGNSLSVKDAAFALLKTDDGKSAGLLLVLSDTPGMCDKVKANRTPKNSSSFTMLAFNLSDTGEALAPDANEYTIRSELVTPPLKGRIGVSFFSKVDANCTETLQDKNIAGQSGIVKITRLDGSANGVASGTFDITVGTQLDKVTGSFNATFCDITKLQANPSCE
ncbi:MAG: hypothetical protein JNK82_21170 [Myxococcaceae bacterium]|nr:hypothetical protein [Myxococcaceae bacterium]